MVKKKNIIKNILLVITVLVLMTLIVYFVGKSYGFFQYVKKGETTNVITIKGIKVDVIEDDDALNLLNAEPLYDTDGMELKAFTFSITNTSSRPIAYTLKVVNDTDKQNACLINEGTEEEATCPVLTTDNIRYSYKLNNESWNEAANLGANNDVITTYTINGNETLTYSIRMWIKSDATNDIMNHYFFGQLLIQGTQAAQEMYRPYDVATILSNFNQEDLKEVVACSNDNKYQDCEIYNTIEEAIAAKDKSVIILTDNLDRTSTFDIASGKDITLDLNGKTISYMPETRMNVLNNAGTLTINDSGTDGTITTTFQILTNTGTLTINGGKFYRNHEEGSGGIIATATNANTIINDGTFITNKTAPIYTWGSNLNVTINGGYFESSSAIVYNMRPNADNTNSNILINGGTFISTANRTIINACKAGNNIDITGGTIISNTAYAVYNTSTGTINITQTDKPIYIATRSTTWTTVVDNLSSGTINIVANSANACTANASDTTEGLCVYAGDQTALLLNGSDATGTINANGGTYVGGRRAIVNRKGIINIKNASITSVNGLLHENIGTVNLCNVTLNSTNYDLYNSSTGAVNYNNVTFSNGTTTPDSDKIYNPSGTITEVATCPITE